MKYEDYIELGKAEEEASVHLVKTAQGDIWDDASMDER